MSTSAWWSWKVDQLQAPPPAPTPTVTNAGAGDGTIDQPATSPTALSALRVVTLATNLPITLTGTVTISGAATLACRIQRAANVLTVAAGSGGYVFEL